MPYLPQMSLKSHKQDPRVGDQRGQPQGKSTRQCLRRAKLDQRWQNVRMQILEKLPPSHQGQAVCLRQHLDTGQHQWTHVPFPISELMLAAACLACLLARYRCLPRQAPNENWLHFLPTDTYSWISIQNAYIHINTHICACMSTCVNTYIHVYTYTQIQNTKMRPLNAYLAYHTHTGWKT